MRVVLICGVQSAHAQLTTLVLTPTPCASTRRRLRRAASLQLFDLSPVLRPSGRRGGRRGEGSQNMHCAGGAVVCICLSPTKRMRAVCRLSENRSMFGVFAVSSAVWRGASQKSVSSVISYQENRGCSEEYLGKVFLYFRESHTRTCSKNTLGTSLPAFEKIKNTIKKCFGGCPKKKRVFGAFVLLGNKKYFDSASAKFLLGRCGLGARVPRGWSTWCGASRCSGRKGRGGVKWEGPGMYSMSWSNLGSPGPGLACVDVLVYSDDSPRSTEKAWAHVVCCCSWFHTRAARGTRM